LIDSIVDYEEIIARLENKLEEKLK